MHPVPVALAPKSVTANSQTNLLIHRSSSPSSFVFFLPDYSTLSPFLSLSLSLSKMLVLSSPSPPLLEVFKDRVSSSSYSSSSSSSSFTLVLRRSSCRRPLLCCCASNLKLMPDSACPSIAEDEDDVKESKIAPLHSGTFLNVRCGGGR